MGFEGVVGGTGGTGSVVGVGRKRAFGAFNLGLSYPQKQKPEAFTNG